MVVEDAVERSSFFSEEPVELIVGQTREIQLLVGEEIHGLRQHPVIDRLEIGRTLGDNHDVGTVLPTLRLAEPSRGQQLIVEDEAMVIDEQDIDARFDIAVLRIPSWQKQQRWNLEANTPWLCRAHLR